MKTMDLVGFITLVLVSFDNFCNIFKKTQLYLKKVVVAVYCCSRTLLFDMRYITHNIISIYFLIFIL